MRPMELDHLSRLHLNQSAITGKGSARRWLITGEDVLTSTPIHPAFVGIKPGTVGQTDHPGHDIFSDPSPYFYAAPF